MNRVFGQHALEISEVKSSEDCELIIFLRKIIKEEIKKILQEATK